MNVSNDSGTRGKKQTFQYGNDSLSITELLKKNEIVNYLEKGRKLTQASRRDKLRKLLNKEGNNLQRLVTEYNLQNPPPQQQQQVRDELYGAQRIRAGLPKKDTKGRVIGPERQPKVPKEPKGVIEINDENLTARQALERYPRLRDELQKDRRISEKSLHAKLRKITNSMINRNPEIVSRESRLLGNNVIDHTINSMVNTDPQNFLNYTRNTIRFLQERPQNKVQLSLICIMMRVDPATGIVTNEEQASFNSNQESIYESTDLEVYERMITKILEAFSTYLKNGSG